MTAPDDPRSALRDRIDLVEESYEFFLAFAAQGMEDDRRSGAGGQLREYLDRLEAELPDLAHGLGRLIAEEGLEPKGPLAAFQAVIADDAAKAGAAISLVRSRPSISSQLVDNLNASIHLRALLTDLFLLDDLLGLKVPATTQAKQGGESPAAGGP